MLVEEGNFLNWGSACHYSSQHSSCGEDSSAWRRGAGKDTNSVCHKEKEKLRALLGIKRLKD